MPNRPATMLMGRASTVTTVSTNRLAVVVFVDVGGDLFLQCSRMRSCKRLHVVQDQRELLGRVAQLVDIGAGHPAGRPLEQAEQRSRFRRQQPLQPHQQAAQRAEVLAPVVVAAGELLVLDIVDARSQIAHDVGQDVGLRAQQVLQQLGAGTRRVASAHDRAQRIDRAQGLEVRAVTTRREADADPPGSRCPGRVQPNSKCTSLITAISACSARSMRVE